MNCLCPIGMSMKGYKICFWKYILRHIKASWVRLNVFHKERKSFYHNSATFLRKITNWPLLTVPMSSHLSKQVSQIFSPSLSPSFSLAPNDKKEKNRSQLLSPFSISKCKKVECENLFDKMGHSRTIFLYFCLVKTVDSEQCSMKISPMTYLWFRKQPLYQLSHNHCPRKYSLWTASNGLNNLCQV